MAGLIFDCDGVLVDSERIYTDLERRMLAEIGLAYDLETYTRRFIGISNADFRAAVASDFAALDRGPWPEDFWERHHAEAWRRFAQELEPLPGAEAFLTEHAGPRAVASSSTITELAAKLAHVGLDRFFGDHVYSAELVQRGKPAPDLFLLAATRIGCAPETCVVVEDSVHGVAAGVAAGMDVWGFTGGGHAGADLPARLAEAGASWVAPDFAAIAERWAAR